MKYTVHVVDENHGLLEEYDFDKLSRAIAWIENDLIDNGQKYTYRIFEWENELKFHIEWTARLRFD